MSTKAADFLIYDAEAGVYRENPEQVVRDDVEKHYWKHVALTVLKDWRLYLMLLPMLLVFLLWRYLPMYELLGSFKKADNVKPVADQFFTGFSTFKELMVGNQAADFWRALRNTFLLSFYGLCFGFPMPILLALFFNEVRSNIVRSTCQVLTYLPKFMSTVVMTSLVYMLVKQGSLTTSYGVIGQVLYGFASFIERISTGFVQWAITDAPWLARLLDLDPQALAASMASWKEGIYNTVYPGLLNNPAYFRAIYQISGVWEGAGYDSIVYFAAIIAISPTSYEAAQIDGAGKMSQMRYVVLPGILSTVVIMLITRIGSLLNIGYEKVLLLYNINTYETADVVSTYAYRLGMDQGSSRPDLASAAEMLNNVISMLLVISANTIARKASDTSLY